MKTSSRTIFLFLLSLACAGAAMAQPAKNSELDQRVGAFLSKMRGSGAT